MHSPPPSCLGPSAGPTWWVGHRTAMVCRRHICAVDRPQSSRPPRRQEAPWPSLLVTFAIGRRRPGCLRHFATLFHTCRRTFLHAGMSPVVHSPTWNLLDHPSSPLLQSLLRVCLCIRTQAPACFGRISGVSCPCQSGRAPMRENERRSAARRTKRTHRWNSRQRDAHADSFQDGAIFYTTVGQAGTGWRTMDAK